MRIPDYFPSVKRARMEDEPIASTSRQALLSFPAVSNVERKSVVESNECDISLLMKRHDINALERYNKVRSPPKDFQYPEKFQYSWLYKWEWLAYSSEANGVLCKVCAFFGIGRKKPANLVSVPLLDFENCTKRFNEHSKTQYHKNACLNLENHKNPKKIKNEAVNNNQSSSIVDDQNVDKKKSIEIKREELLPIIATVLLCGRQNIALRGKFAHDSLLQDEQSYVNNVHAIIRLLNHSNEALTNPSEMNILQNEILTCCHNIIRQQIVNEINSSKGFSVLIDGPADIAGKQHLFLCVRYVTESLKIKLEFLEFVPIVNDTNKALADTIISNLQRIGLDCKFRFGQGYDSAASMSKSLQDAQTHIAKRFDLALYVHCASHSLNMAIFNCTGITSIRNALGVLKAINNFFIKRQEIIHNSKIEIIGSDQWLQRCEAAKTYIQLQDAVIETLENAAALRDIETSSLAYQLLQAIKSIEFQVAIHTCVDILSITLSLSQMLQAEKIDMKKIIHFSALSKEQLENKLKNVENVFETIFKNVADVCEKYDINISIPKQSTEIKSAESYFLSNVYLPFLNAVIQNLEIRFLQHSKLLSSFETLLTSHENECAAKILFEKYGKVLPCDNDLTIVVNEIRLWQGHLSKIQQFDFETAIDALNACDEKDFPNVHFLLKILCILPVTPVTNEQSFSSLPMLNNYLSSTISEARFNGSASLAIHHDVIVTSEDVLNALANNSKIKFKADGNL